MNTPSIRKPRSRSQLVKTVLIVITAICFLLFYMIGYDMPSLRNPALTEPWLTPLIIWLMIAMLGIAVVLTIGSIIIGIRKGNGKKRCNNIPLTKIGWGVTALLAVTLLLTFLTGNTDSIPVNGKAYSDSLWLRASTMFVLTSAVMMIVAVAIAIVSMIRKMMNSNS